MERIMRKAVLPVLLVMAVAIIITLIGMGKPWPEWIFYITLSTVLIGVVWLIIAGLTVLYNHFFPAKLIPSDSDEEPEEPEEVGLQPTPTSHEEGRFSDEIEVGERPPRSRRTKGWLGWLVGGIVFISLFIFLLSVNSRVSDVKMHIAAIDTTITALQNVDAALADSVKSLKTEIGNVNTIAKGAKSAAETAQSTANDALSKANNAQWTANKATNLAKSKIDTTEFHKAEKAVENQLAAKADTSRVAALEKKVSSVADTTIAKAMLLDTLKLVQRQITATLTKSDYTLNKRVDSLKTANAAQDTTIANQQTAIANIQKMVAADTTRLTAMETQLAKINVQTDFLILREATRFAQIYATIKRQKFDATLVQKFINASVKERQKMWEDLEK